MNGSAPSERTLSEWLSYLESIHPSAIDMGLTRVRQVADTMALSLSESTLITVAGTNGKGTTCRLIEAILLSQGKSVGVYSSPHLLDYRERVRINGDVLSEQAYCSAFEHVEKARGTTSLTYFEFGTLAALDIFKQHQPEVVLLEVGLGGRLDATNILDPDLAVITTIDLDHQAWLGNTRDAVAREKAGILRDQGPAVIGEYEPPASLQAEVDRLNADASWALRDFSLIEHGQDWSWRCGDVEINNLPWPQIPLQNASTAFAVLYRLGWLEDNQLLRETLIKTALPGRCQRLSSKPEVVVDVAHNPQATRALRQWIDAQDAAGLHIIVGMLSDKALDASLAPLASLSANWYTAATPGDRGLTADAMGNALRNVGVNPTQQFDSVTSAYRHVRSHCATSERIVVFGSFLTVADVLALHSGSEGVYQ